MFSNAQIGLRITRNALMLYTRMIVTILIGLYTSRVVLEQLGITDFGIYSAIGSLIALTEFINSALSNSYSRFFAYQIGQGNKPSNEKIFTAAFTISIIAALIIFILGKTIGIWYFSNHLEIPSDRIDVARFTYNCSLICAALRVLQLPYSSCLIAHEKMVAFAYIEILNSILRLGVAILLIYHLHDKLYTYSVLILAITLIIFVCYCSYCRIMFSECIYTLHPYPKNTLIQMSKFSILDLYGTFCYSTRTHGTALILNSFFGVALNASNAIALSVQNILNGVAGNIITAFNPQIIKQYSAGAIDSMLDFTFKATRYTFYLFFIIATPLIIETEQILHLWLGNNIPEYSISLCRLIIISTGLAIPINILNTCIHATGRIKLLSIGIGSIYLLTLPIIYVAFKYGFSPNYAYIIYATIMCLIFILTLLNVKHLIHKFNLRSYSTYVIIPIFSVLAVSTLIPLFCHFILEGNLMRVIIVTIASILTTTGSIILLGLNPNERNLLISKIKK